MEYHSKLIAQKDDVVMLSQVYFTTVHSINLHPVYYLSDILS